jgi:hypothetical protein
MCVRQGIDAESILRWRHDVFVMENWFVTAAARAAVVESFLPRPAEASSCRDETRCHSKVPQPRRRAARRQRWQLGQS